MTEQVSAPWAGQGRGGERPWGHGCRTQARLGDTPLSSFYCLDLSRHALLRDPLSVVSHNRMHSRASGLALEPSMGNGASHSQGRARQPACPYAWRRGGRCEGSRGMEKAWEPSPGIPGTSMSHRIAGHFWPVRAPNGLTGSTVQGAGLGETEGGPLNRKEAHSPEASVPLPGLPFRTSLNSRRTPPRQAAFSSFPSQLSISSLRLIFT